MIEITMTGPARNALGTEMMTFLLEQLSEAAGRPVLLTGAGEAFSAGLDLREVASLQGDAPTRFLTLLERCMCALYLYPGPTVALVNGHAIAGGAVLTLCCDRRVCVDDPKLKIGLNEVALGVRFPPRILTIVRRRVPMQHHEEVLLGGALFSPQRALQLGLIDEVAQDAGAVARARLEALAGNPADSYAAIKRELRGAVDQDLVSDAAAAEALRVALSSWTSPALKARVEALLGKKR